MWQSAPAAFPLLRSRLTAAVLARTYLGGEEYSITELSVIAQTDSGTMGREVARLEQAGVLRSRRVGRTKLVRANEEAPFYRPLHDLVAITLGPAQILAEELAGLAGIREAAVFGSWAARIRGEPGPAPIDIDLLVIGRPDRDELYDATGRASARLGREVNAVVVAPERWDGGDEGFLAELRSRPRVAVIDATGTHASGERDE